MKEKNVYPKKLKIEAIAKKQYVLASLQHTARKSNNDLHQRRL